MKRSDLIKFACMLWEDGHMKTYYDDLDFDEYLRLMKKKQND